MKLGIVLLLLGLFFNVHALVVMGIIFLILGFLF